MKKERKIVSTILALTMTAALLAGCTTSAGPNTGAVDVDTVQAEVEATGGGETAVSPESTAEDTEEGNTDHEVQLEYWTEGSAAKAEIEKYVAEVTDPASEKFIPAEDRIVCFDLDGTLIGEHYPSDFKYMMFIHRVLYDENYKASEDMQKFAKELEEGLHTGNLPENYQALQGRFAGQAFAGMTPDELKAYTKEFMNTEAEGFNNLTRGEAFFLPMVSLVNYLTANDFICYIVSSTDRTVIRGLIEDVLPIPSERVIGISYAMVATGQDGKDGIEYQYAPDDDIIRGEEVIIRPIRMNKVSEIAVEIGKVPVLSFGNNPADLSVAQYTKNNKKYEGKAFMILHDDNEREYEEPDNVAILKKSCDELGFTMISMRDDFATIYGDGVTIVK